MQNYMVLKKYNTKKEQNYNIKKLKKPPINRRLFLFNKLSIQYVI